MDRRTVLIVDGDETLSRSVAAYLETHMETRTVLCGDGASAHSAVHSGWIDAALIAVDLPDMNGRDLCRLLRRQGYAETIMLWAFEGGEAEIVLGLESGADDYLIRPFSEKVLAARLRAHLRKRDHDRDPVYQIGEHQFWPAAKELTLSRSRRKVHLTKKESQLLLHLYRSSPRAVSRTTLLQQVWGYSSDASTQTLESHIYRLRQKIETDPGSPRIIVAESSGYRLLA